MNGQSLNFVRASTSRLQVKRNGHSIIRREGVPKPFVIVDTREKQPLPLVSRSAGLTDPKMSSGCAILTRHENSESAARRSMIC